MAYPTKYSRQYDFQSYQNANPTRPLPGDKVNVDFNYVVDSIDDVVEFQKLIQRSDGALQNGIVTLDALADAVKAMIGDNDTLAGLVEDFDAVEANKTAAAASATAAATSATTAAASATSATNSASAASASETNAASSASAASTSASNAATSASEASTSASDAAAEAATATTQAGLAQAAAVAAANSLDSFDDRYLGAKAADPTLDNDGNALLDGALYWNTSTGLKIYSLGTTTWNAYSAAVGISNVVEDTTPQLGGDLDLNGHVITGLEPGTGANNLVQLDSSSRLPAVNASLLTNVPNDSSSVSNSQSASYTAVLTDAGKTVRINNASANNFTIPLNSSVAFPVDTYINIEQYGAGQTTVVATGGVTIRSRLGLKLAGQYAMATIHKIGTDEWILGGDLTS